MSLLELKNVCFSYEKQTILQDINLSLEAGDVLCLVGPNGCGKTTLLDCVIGALKIGKGSIRLKGQDILSLKPQEIARVVAYVPQLHERTFPYTVLEIVLMGRAPYTSLFSAPSAEDVSAAERALEMVGLCSYKNRPYTKLSGGEGQLVMLTRALAQSTPVLVLDEPTSHLDFNNEIIFLETITRLVKETDVAVLMATHFPNHAFTFQNSGINTRIAIMHEKGIAAVGIPDDVLSEENIRRVFNVNAKVLSYSQIDKRYNYILPMGTAS